MSAKLMGEVWELDLPAAEVKRLVRERDGHRCQDCGGREVLLSRSLIGIAEDRGDGGARVTPALEVHRLVPGSEGGRYALDNCVLLCGACHGARHGRKTRRWARCCADHPHVLPAWIGVMHA